MKNNILIIFLSALLLAACAHQNPNQILLLHGNYFAKLPNEEIMEIDSSLLDFYEMAIGEIAYKSPVYRNLMSEQYQLILAIPFDVNPDQYKATLSSKFTPIDSFETSYLYQLKNTNQAVYCNYIHYKKSQLFIVYIPDSTVTSPTAEDFYNRIGKL